MIEHDDTDEENMILDLDPELDEEEEEHSLAPDYDEDYDEIDD